MQVTKDDVHTTTWDVCSSCDKNDTGCVFKKALSNYHDGCGVPIKLTLIDCPEYIMAYDRDDRVHWTLNPSAIVRINTGD